MCECLWNIIRLWSTIALSIMWAVIIAYLAQWTKIKKRMYMKFLLGALVVSWMISIVVMKVIFSIFRNA